MTIVFLGYAFHHINSCLSALHQTAAKIQTAGNTFKQLTATSDKSHSFSLFVFGLDIFALASTNLIVQPHFNSQQNPRRLPPEQDDPQLFSSLLNPLVLTTLHTAWRPFRRKVASILSNLQPIFSPPLCSV